VLNFIPEGIEGMLQLESALFGMGDFSTGAVM